jgi:RNA polymerase sigma-B factor
VPQPDTPCSPTPQQLDDRTKALLLEARDATDDAERERLREDAVTMNMPLARAIASRYRAKGVEWEDLVQVSYLALIKAVAGFDPHSPYRFSAYASATVRGEIKRWFRDHDWIVRPPRRFQELRLVISQAEVDLAQELGRTPCADDLASELGVTTREVEASTIAGQGRRSLSLDAPGYEPGGSTLGDRVPEPGDDIDLLEWKLALGSLVERLEPRARLILQMRFGKEATQAEIGKALGVSQMHVSRLLSGLLDDLRQELQIAV